MLLVHYQYKVQLMRLPDKGGVGAMQPDNKDNIHNDLLAVSSCVMIAGDSKPAIQQQHQVEPHEQLSTGHTHMPLQHEACTPPIPDARLMPISNSDIIDTDAPSADQDPPTGYPTPASSGDSSGAHAAHDPACQDTNIGHDSPLLGGCSLSPGAGEWAPGVSLSSLPSALLFSQQYQQLQAWQLQQAWQQQQQQYPYQQQQQQQEHCVQVTNFAVGNRSSPDEGCISGQSCSSYQSSPVPSQDPPTGYPTPCASSDDTNSSTPPAGWRLPHGDARVEKDHGGSFSGNKFHVRFPDAPRAYADLCDARRRLEHECSCHNTPVPSQDAPSEHSDPRDDECSFAGGAGVCSMGHYVTAPPSLVHSQAAGLPGSEEENGMNGSYAHAVGDAPPSPVPSQDAPSEYPDPVTPALSAEESEAECSVELSDTREPLPPGVEQADTRSTATSPGELSSGMSRASFHQAGGSHSIKTSSFTESPHNVPRPWWEDLEEQGPFDCVWDDYESGDDSVDSPRRGTERVLPCWWSY